MAPIGFADAAAGTLQLLAPEIYRANTRAHAAAFGRINPESISPWLGDSYGN